MGTLYPRDVEPFSAPEVVPSELAVHPSPQHLDFSSYQTQLERDIAQKQAIVDADEGLGPRYGAPKENAQAAYFPVGDDNLPASHINDQRAKRKRRKWMILLAVVVVI